MDCSLYTMTNNRNTRPQSTDHTRSIDIEDTLHNLHPLERIVHKQSGRPLTQRTRRSKDYQDLTG